MTPRVDRCETAVVSLVAISTIIGTEMACWAIAWLYPVDPGFLARYSRPGRQKPSAADSRLFEALVGLYE